MAYILARTHADEPTRYWDADTAFWREHPHEATKYAKREAQNLALYSSQYSAYTYLAQTLDAATAQYHIDTGH